VDIIGLRLRFKPGRVRVLLVGEAPPSSPTRGFFYDPIIESTLSHAVKQVFEEVYGVRYRSKLEFLEDFRGRGFYLHDLFDERGKKICEATREEVDEALRRLEKLIDESKPELVVAVLTRIGSIVRRACGGKVRCEVLRFPIPPYRDDFKDRLSDLIKQIK